MSSTPGGSNVVTRVLRVEKAEDLNVMDGSKATEIGIVPVFEDEERA